MWTNKVIPLITGMDSSIGQGMHPEPILARLINAKINKQGEIEKRNGSAALGIAIADSFTVERTIIDIDGAGTPFMPRSLISLRSTNGDEANDVLYALTDTTLLRYFSATWRPADIVETSATDGFYKPTAVGCATSYSVVGRSERDHHATQTATSGNYTLVCWIECEDSAEAQPRLYYSVYVNDTLAAIVDGVKVSSVDVMYAMTCGWASSLGIVYIEGNNLKLLNLTNPYAPVTTTLKTTAFNGGTGTALAPFYVARSKTDALVIAYRDMGATELTAFNASWAGVVTNSTTYATAGSPRSVAIEYDSVSDTVVLVACVGTGANNIITKILDSTLVDQALDVSFTTSTNTRIAVRIAIGFNAVVAGVSSTTQPDTFIAWELDDSGATLVPRVDICGRLTSGIGSTMAVVSYRRCTLLSTFFKHNTTLYVCMGNKSELQGGLYVFAVGSFIGNKTSACIAGKSAPGFSAGVMDGRRFDYMGPPARILATPSNAGIYLVANRIKTKYVQDTSISLDFTRSCVARLDFTSPVSYVEVGGILYFANGSILKQYENASVTETGFLVSPEVDASAITVTAAAGALSAGSYSWRFYYEAERAGRLVRSYAFTVTATVALNDSADIPVPSSRFTQRKEGDVYIVGYRTAVNPTPSSPYYRVTALSPTNTSGTAGWYINDTAVDTITVTDTVADAALILQTDYLFAGEVGHVLPDSQQFVTQHGNRLVTASSKSVQPSLLFSSNFAVEFADELETEITDTGGAITGISNLGNNLAIFKRNKVLVIGGSGPDNTNQGSYTDEYEISGAVGNNSQATICKVPGGVAFAGPRGFYLLNESLQLDFIGQPVYQNYKADGSEIIRVVYNSEDNCLSFMASNGYEYIYYMLARYWVVNFYTYTVKDALCFNGLLHVYYDEHRTVMCHSEALGDDSLIASDGAAETNNFDHIITTDYLPIVEGDQASHSRIQSVMFTGRYLSTAQYTVDVSYDGANNLETSLGGTFEDSGAYTMLAAGATTWPSDKARFEHPLARQKCSSIQIRLKQAHNSRGAAWSQIVLRVKASQNGAKMSPRRTT